MKDQKILFFDIDGTLLTAPPFSVPESTKLALKKAREQGHLLFVNSGRTLGMISPLIRELDFDGYVCGCGSQIYMHDQLLFSSTVPHELCRKTIAVLRECRVAAFFEQPSGILYDGDSPVSCMDVEHLKDRVKAVDLCGFPRRQAESFTFDKFLAFLQEDTLEEKFRAFCEEHFRYFDHGRRIWEVTQKSCSKATGMEFLLKKLGIPRENSYAFGDSTNDLPMLEYAGHSIAMGNSMEEILPCCSYQTTDVDQDGIYNAMLHFGLIG